MKYNDFSFQFMVSTHKRLKILNNMKGMIILTHLINKCKRFTFSVVLRNNKIANLD